MKLFLFFTLLESPLPVKVSERALNYMYIVHIASEMSPIAKAGGLGDVVHGLAKEQKAFGNQVEIIIPKYDTLNYEHINDLQLENGNLWSYEDAFRYHNSVWKCSVDGLDTFLIEPHHNQYYFNRGAIYGCFNDIERFLYFCRAATEHLFTSKRKPDIIHLHDWPTAAVAPLIKTLYADLGYSCGAVIMTIHNIEHQGKCHPKNLTRIGLRGDDFRTAKRMQDEQNSTLINLLKGGINYADYLTTVSPMYANEIKTKEFGFSLNSVIIENEHKLCGILNGIELETWNPSKDPHITINFPSNPTFIDKVLALKKKNQETLLNTLKMRPTKGPLIACISRLAQQKGPKLIQEAIRYTIENNGSFILLGSTEDIEIEQEFLQLESKYKSTKALYIGLEFNEPLARQIFASADALVIPSLFEPCGLTQMISMRYGTVPIGRKTGGLADTINDIEDEAIPNHLHTGFLFEEPNFVDLNNVLDRAFNCFHNDQKEWRTLIQNGMNIDFGWKSSAMKYQKMYGWALKEKKSQKKRLLHAI